MKILAILLLAACALGQPPTVDSVRVFPGEYGYWSRVERLPGGDYIMAGFFWNGGLFESLRVARATPDLETIWQWEIMSNSFWGFQDFVVTDNRVLIVAPEEIPVDSNSWTSHSVAINLTLSGDSVWVRSYDDPINYDELSSITEDGSGGYYILGSTGIYANETFDYQARLLHVDPNGDTLWTRYYGGELNEFGGKVLKLDGDSLAFTILANVGDNYHLALVWTNLNGDSLGGVVYDQLDSASAVYPPGLQRRETGWEIVWLDYGTTSDTQSLVWVRAEYDGTPISQERMVIPRNSCQSYARIPEGMMTVGYSNWGDQDRNLVIGRVTDGGLWEYLEEVELPNVQEGYSFFPNDGDLLAVFGRTQSHPDSMVVSTLIYLHDNSGASYLFASPPRLNFGVVPLQETQVRDISLITTRDSAVTISAIDVPDHVGVSLQVPVTILPDDTLHYQIAFRPEELRQYLDTVFVHSDAWNAVLPIQITGQAPYPVCTPATTILDFNWVRVGTESRRPLLIRNAGTATLHIDELPQLDQYTVEPTGPFVLPVDSSVLLSVTFHPESLEVYHERLVVTSDDPAGADTIMFAGRGVANPNDAEELPALPTKLELHPAYPNPFNATTTLQFDLPATSNISLDLYNISGRLVREILRGEYSAGTHSGNVALSDVSSGIYFAVLNARGVMHVQKLLLIR